jgi:hypothetical protein
MTGVNGFEMTRPFFVIPNVMRNLYLQGMDFSSRVAGFEMTGVNEFEMTKKEWE